MKLLIDTNVLLDVLLRRQPWAADARTIWASVEAGRVGGVIAAVSVPNVYYLARKVAPAKAGQAVLLLLATFDVVAFGKNQLAAAHGMLGGDFEDNLQIEAAIEAGADAIITRDLTGFAHSPIQVMTPSDLVQMLPSLP